MRIFILEDDQIRIQAFRAKLASHDLTFAETAQDAITILGSNFFDAIFLDHDLGGEQMVGTEGANTGSEVVRWMCQHQENVCHVVIHSLNTPAANDMYDKLSNIGMVCQRIPFTRLVRLMDDPNFIQEK